MEELMSGQNGRYEVAVEPITLLREHEHPSVDVTTRAALDMRWQDERFLSRAALRLTDTFDEAAIREHAVRLPLPFLADWCVLHPATPSEVAGDDASLVVCAHADPQQEPRARTIWQRTVRVTPSTIPSLSRVLYSGERPVPSVKVNVVIDDVIDPVGGMHTNSAAARLLARVGLATALHVPLMAGNRGLGVLTIASATPGRYGARQVALAIRYANRVAAVLDRARRFRQAGEMLRARDVTLTEIVHDLKTPAAQIAEYAAATRRRLSQEESRSSWEQSDAQALRDCHEIESIASSLLGMLDDLMAVPDCEAGIEVGMEAGMRAEMGTAAWTQETDLIELARQMVERYRQLAAGYTLHLETGNLVRMAGYWNPGALTRILDNVLSNAIAFSRPSDTITVRIWRGEARLQPGARRRDWAYLQVRDQGAGIPQRDLPRVFEPYYRGSNVRKLVSGSGIGLTSVQHLVQRHGGRVRIASEPGEGASLTIMLPFDPPPRAAQPNKRKAGAMGRRVRPVTLDEART